MKRSWRVFTPNGHPRSRAETEKSRRDLISSLEAGFEPTEDPKIDVSRLEYPAAARFSPFSDRVIVISGENGRFFIKNAENSGDNGKNDEN